MRIALLLAATLAAAPVARAQAPAPTAFTPQPSVSLPPELDRVLRDYERAWRAGDESALTALFTPDGFVPSRTGWVRGSDAIRAAYADGSGPLNLRAHAFAVADTVGYIVGAYRYGDDPGGRDNGKFVLALRKGRGGQWLIAADLDQGNRQ